MCVDSGRLWPIPIPVVGSYGRRGSAILRKSGMMSVAGALNRPLSIVHADEALEDGVPDTEHRGGFRQSIRDGTLAGIGVQRTAFDHGLAAADEDGF